MKNEIKDAVMNAGSYEDIAINTQLIDRGELRNAISWNFGFTDLIPDETKEIIVNELIEYVEKNK